MRVDKLGEVSENAKSFIQCCLTKDPAARPCILELYNHPWIRNTPAYSSTLEDSNNCASNQLI